MQSNRTIRFFGGATAIVTGGASGIGRALAVGLAKRGCEVVLADLQIELAEEVASEINASGGKTKAVKIDVTDFPAMERLVQQTVQRTGRLDYIFNNAGIVIGGSVNLYGIEDWNQVIDVNLRGVINGIQAAYKIMMAQGFGHIVNTAYGWTGARTRKYSLYNDQACSGGPLRITPSRSCTGGSAC
jgi:NAD(P)-dependent dehydrogenase (short-subunit alcohol dehydrogenase family)